MAAAAHGPVLVIAPTTARAEAGCAALRSRGAQVALLPGDWAQARAGADVVIGTRAAAWGPCPGVASVVVLDAHDEGLVQGAAPTWDAPSVAAERARLAAVPCLWVTPCPTVELIAAADQVHVASVSPSGRVGPPSRSWTAGARTPDQGFTRRASSRYCGATPGSCAS